MFKYPRFQKFIITLTLALAIFSVQKLEAQVELVHRQLTPQDLRDPGTTLPLEVRVLNSRNTELTLKAYISRDDQLFTAIDFDPEFNERYELIFRIPIRSPKANLWYRFVLEAGDQKITSPTYQVARECLPEGPSIPSEISDQLSGLNPDQLAYTALGLEREILMYENTVNLIEDFKELLDG